MFKMVLWLGPKIPALYPKERTRAEHIEGSKGSHFSGQNNSGFLCLDQLVRLVPPSPWTRMMSSVGLASGSCITLKPIGSLSPVRSCSPCVRPCDGKVRKAGGVGLAGDGLRWREAVAALSTSTVVPLPSNDDCLPRDRGERWESVVSLPWDQRGFRNRRSWRASERLW